MFAYRLLCLWLLASPAIPAAVPPASAPAAITPADAVTITHDAPVVDRVMFNRASPPDAMPKLKPGEAALTRSSFECRAGVSYENLSQQQIGDHWHVVAKIHRVNVETRLTDTIYLPMMAPVLLRAHEEGHREMNERIYKEGEAAAHSAGLEIMSHNWEADGPDPDSAGKAATDMAVQQMCKAYLAKTADRASRLGDIYDRFTDHGRNQLYVANAIRLSFLEEQHMPTTRPDQLLHATTTSASN
jgi:hypothetical protein